MAHQPRIGVLTAGMGASGRPHHSPLWVPRHRGSALPQHNPAPCSIKLGWPGCLGASCLPSSPAACRHPFALTSCYCHPHQLCQPHHPWAARDAQGTAPCRAAFRSQQLQGAARRSTGLHSTPSTAVWPDGSLTQKGWLWGACLAPQHCSCVATEHTLRLSLQQGLHRQLPALPLSSLRHCWLRSSPNHSRCRTESGNLKAVPLAPRRQAEQPCPASRVRPWRGASAQCPCISSGCPHGCITSEGPLPMVGWPDGERGCPGMVQGCRIKL